MRIVKRKKGLWEKIDDKLFDWGQALMYNPKILIITLYSGLIFFGIIFGLVAYMFWNLAKNGAVGYYFGFGIMSVLSLATIYGLYKMKTFRNVFKELNVTQMNDMMYGDLVNPMIDKFKNRKNKEEE